MEDVITKNTGKYQDVELGVTAIFAKKGSKILYPDGLIIEIEADSLVVEETEMKKLWEN